MGKSVISGVGFVATILCFLMPFFTVSCGGQKFMQFSGVDLAIGKTIDQPAMFGPSQKRKIDPSPLASLAIVAAVAGAVMAFARKGFPLGTAISGLAGGLFLFIMKARIGGEAATQGMGMITISFEPGFVVAMVLFLGLGVWNLVLLFTDKPRLAYPPSAPPPPPAYPTPPRY